MLKKKILFLILIIIQVQSKGETPADRELQLRKYQCEKKEFCGHLPSLLNENCVNLCISESCFTKTFGLDLMEIGEFDSRKNFKFRDCFKNLFRSCKSNKEQSMECEKF